MVFALLNSFVCLMRSFVMIVIVMFVFAIILQHVVATHCEEVDTSDEIAMAHASAWVGNWERLVCAVSKKNTQRHTTIAISIACAIRIGIVVVICTVIVVVICIVNVICTVIVCVVIGIVVVIG